MSTNFEDEIRAGMAEGAAQRLHAVPTPRTSEAPTDAASEGGDTRVASEADSGPVSEGWVLDVARPTLDPARAAVFERWAAHQTRRGIASTRLGRKAPREDSAPIRARWGSRAALWCRARSLAGVAYYPEARLDRDAILRDLVEATRTAARDGRSPAELATLPDDALAEAASQGWADGAAEPMLAMDKDDPRRPRRGSRQQGVLPSADQMRTAMEGAAEGGGPVGEIVAFARERWRFFRDGSKLYALPHNGSRVAMPVGERSPFRRILTRELLDERSRSFRGDSYSVALDVLRSEAEAAEPEAVALRAAHWRDGIVLDLGRADGVVVEVRPEGWRTVPAAPVHPIFRRSSHVHPLPDPVRGWGLDPLKSLLSLTDEQWLLVRAWLVTLLLYPCGDVPILYLTGPEGAGKTLRSAMVASVLDPRGRVDRARGGQLGRTNDDILIPASHQFVVGFDNLSSLTGRQSDLLCGISTGTRHEARTHYTDDEATSTPVQRGMVVTGRYMPGGAGSDLLDRTVQVDLARLVGAAIRTPDALWSAFDAAHPEILGGLLDLAVEVLRVRATVDADPDRSGYERMASYSLVLMCLDAIGARDGGTVGHMSAFLSASRETKTERVDLDPVLAALLELLAGEKERTWSGSATALFSALHRPDGVQTWPGNGQALSRHLGKSVALLQAVGITVTRDREDRLNRNLVVTLAPDEDAT
ncbi:hypothetical protein [Pseudonocardia alni]|uniref:hypothetical protein n=1 Tax=Pseudonocardia alni TaxID=33907 RepID=UPI003321B7E9